MQFEQDLKNMQEEIANINKNILFPLFKNRNNKCYIWMIELEYDSNLKGINVKTFYGYKNMKMTTRSYFISKGKVNRTLVEQAQLEALSKWTDKVKKDCFEIYKETYDKATTGVVIDDSEKAEEAEEVKRIQNANSKMPINTKREFRPMLAQKFDLTNYESLNTTTNNKKKFQIQFPFIIQPKLDGIRCVASTNTEKDEILLVTRNGKNIETFQNLRKELLVLFEALKEKSNNVILDGELYTNEIPFEALSGLVRVTHSKLTEKRESEIDKIQFCIFDCYDGNNPDCPFYERHLHYLQKYILPSFVYIKLVPYQTCPDSASFLRMHETLVKQGYEGTMVRDANSPYECDKRSKYLQKYKTVEEEEYTIVNFFEGNKEEKGMILFTCCLNDNPDVTFDVRPRGTAKYRKELFLVGDTLIGKQLTVMFHGKLSQGIPRFGVGKAIRMDI